MVPGMAGIMFRQLGWIVSIIMIVSTVGALSLTPMLCSQLLKLDPHKGKLWLLIFRPIEKALDGLDRFYERCLKFVVSHRTVTICSMFAIFIASMFLIKIIPTEFFPTNDNVRLGAKVELPIGTRTEIARELAIQIEKEFID